jgi:hypothetical protein
VADVPSGPSLDSTPHYANLKKKCTFLKQISGNWIGLNINGQGHNSVMSVSVCGGEYSS